MRVRFSAALMLLLACAAGAGADTFDALTERMSVARNGNVVVATRASPDVAARHARRISAYDAEIRRRYFPSLEDQSVRFIVSDDASELEALAEAPSAGLDSPSMQPFGYYRRDHRVVFASTAKGDGAVLRELVRALLATDNPNAPRWFETAMSSLYESSHGNGAARTPILDDRMARIPADEDLDYDVFAGICDCYPPTAEQLALMRLLVVHLHERGELVSLYEVVARKGQYVTLLECLEAMDFDYQAWKRYAERSVREYWKTHDASS